MVKYGHRDLPKSGWTDIRTDIQRDIKTYRVTYINKEVKMKEPKFIAFSTQKGGAGKTTLTVLAASYLHYVKGLNIGVIDCDFPQFSIMDMRKRDMKNIEGNSQLCRQAYDMFKKLGKKAYPVVESRPEDAIDVARQMMEKQEFDIIFFDLPGTLNNKGAVNTIAHMDYVFCPIVADRVVMQSSLTYAKLVNDNMVTTGQTNIKGFYFVWNMVDAREKTRLYDIYNKVINELGLTALNTEVPDSKRFRREGDTEDKRPLFRSTMFPSDRTLIKGSCIRELTDEILDIIKL